MIDELNHSIERWLRTAASLPADQVEVQFDRPEADWDGRRSMPLVNLFIYELAPSSRRAIAGSHIVPDGEGGFGRVAQVPMIEARYLVGVWGAGSGGEHDILARIVNMLALHRAIPEAFLSDVLRQARPQPTLTLAPDERSSVTQLWQALNVPARASTQLLVEAPMALPTVVQLAPPPTSVHLDTRSSIEPAAFSQRRRVMGRLPGAAGGRVVTRRGAALVQDSGRYNVEGEPGDEIQAIPPTGQSRASHG